MRALIVGICGKMGRELIERAPEFGVNIVGGIDLQTTDACPVFSRAEDVNVQYDVVIDFSRPSSLDSVNYLCRKNLVPCVIATTGYSNKEENKIRELSKIVPVFKSENMSLGVNVLAILAEKATSMLENFDIEIIEKHHNQKVDAPSGTANMLCNAIARSLYYDPEYHHGRLGDAKRLPDEIGVHSVRGGTIVGEHEVLFCGNHETLSISHSAESRTIFADGALKAALWLRYKKPGLYDMHDLLDF